MLEKHCHGKTPKNFISSVTGIKHHMFIPLGAPFKGMEYGGTRRETLNSLWILALILFWHRKDFFQYLEPYFNSLSTIPLWKVLSKLLSTLFFSIALELWKALSWKIEETVFLLSFWFSQENAIVFLIWLDSFRKRDGTKQLPTDCYWIYYWYLYQLGFTSEDSRFRIFITD